MKTVTTILVHSMFLAAVIVAGTGCGDKDKTARAQAQAAQQQYAALKADTDKMQADFKRITECLANPANNTQELRAANCK